MKSSNYYNNILKSIKGMRMGVLLFLLSYILFIGKAWGQTEITETFESAAAGASTFTSGGKTFTIISNAGGQFDIQDLYPVTGWNGTGPDNKYIDNDGTAEAFIDQSFSIKIEAGLTYSVKKFYLFLADHTVEQYNSGTVTIKGKLGGTTVFTATATSGFVQSTATNNGFTPIDLTTFGGANNSTKVIDELEISTTEPFTYVCLDALTWKLEYVCPTITIDTQAQTNVACKGTATGSVTVAPSGGTAPYSYSWTLGAGTAATASNLTAGTYTVTVTDKMGCTATKTITITEPAAALAGTATKTDVSCFGGGNGTATVSVTGGTSGYSYSWAPSGGTAATATGLSAGTYTVTVTDANACQITRTVTVGQPAAALAGTATKTDVSCFGGGNGTATVSVTGGTPGYTYSWAPSGGTAATATGLSAGTYTVTVTDANACQITRTVTVGQPAAALAGTATKTDVSCFNGNNGTATVAVTGGTPGYTYSWAPSGGTAATATGLSARTYTVTVTDANACQITRTVTVGQPAAALTGTATKTDVSCFNGSNGTATVVASGGTGPYTYSWAPSGGTAATASGLAAGTYIVTVKDANNCQITRTVTVGQPAAALAGTITKTDVSCFNGSNGTATVVASGGTGPYTYSWAPSGGTNATASGLAAGTYTVTVTDNNSCQITRTITVNQPSFALSATATQTDVSCNGGSNGTATVSVTGGTPGYTYSWAPSGGTAATATGLAAGTYTVIVTDANACQTTASVTVGEPAALTATISKTDVSCNGGTNGSATVTATGGTGAYTYSWAPSGGTAATATGLVAGTYTVTVTDNNGCFITRTITIGQPSATVTVSTSDPVNVAAQTVTLGGDVPGSSCVIEKGIVYGTNALPTTSNNKIIGGSGSGTFSVDISGLTVNTLYRYRAYAIVNGTVSYGAVKEFTTFKYDQQISFNAIASKTYGDASFDLGDTHTNRGLLITYTAADPSIVSITGNQATILKSGTTTITATQAGDQNNNPATPVSRVLTVAKAVITVTADVKTKVYGTADPALTYKVTGMVNNDAATVVTGTLKRATGENVGTYAISNNDLAASNYAITYVGADLTITKANLTVTADAKTKVYGTADPALTYKVTGMVNNDAATVVTGTLKRSAGENVGTYAISNNDLAASNYTITYVGADLTITKANLTVTADAKTKVYGTADPALTYKVTGLVNNDAATVVTGTLKRSAGENVGTYAISNNDLAASNYTITYMGSDLTITKANLTVTADAKTKVYGTTDPALTYKVTGMVNNDAATVVTGTLKRATGENIGTYAISNNDLAASNYTITYVGADLTITKANLTVTADTKTKVYGTADPALTYKVTGMVNNDAATVVTGTLKRATGENVGTYAISNNDLAASNYTITYVGADLTITKANLTVTADAKTKVYGSSDPALTYKVTGMVNNDAATVVTGTLKRATGENVGTYAISNNDLAASNYTITYVGANLTITKANLTVTADAKTKVYGTTDPALTYKVTGMVNNDAATVVTGTLKRATGENVGTYAISNNDLAASNYTITYVGADLTITKANLTVTADAKTKVYGTTDPALTYKVTGMVNNDAATVVTGTLKRSAGENVGTYAISNNDLAASNYTITYVGANLTITKANLTVTADAKTKVYGTTDPALTYKVTGMVNNDAATVVTGTLKRATGENVGTYAISNNDLAASNYTITYVGADLTITKANLTVTADAKTKVYGTADPALTYKVTGLVNNDAATIVTGTLKRATGENVGTYAISNNDLAASNYAITYVGANLTITKANLTVTADAKTKVYGTADPALSYKVTGMVNNDAATVVTGTLKRSAGENVGTYAISNNDLAASNYTITYMGSDLTITKANLTVTADAKTKVYGTTDPALTYKVTGMVNNDAATVVTGTLKRATGENEGTYAISNNDLAASNYTITYVGADLTITKANLTVTADAKTKVYGTADPALTYKVTGLVNNDAATVVTGTLKRAAGENVGTYAISNNDLAASNYLITYAGANLTITKATITGITLSDASFTYDAAAKSILISGTLPAGTTVSYTGNNQTAAGTYTVTANIDGGINYTNLSLQATLKINKAKQVITFKEIPAVYRDAGTLSLDISSNSPLPIKIYSDNTLVAEVTGNQEVTVRGVGLALIRAEQSGDANYIAADAVTRELRVRNEDGAKLPVRV
ncbi:MBG domain-containing protein, partial [Sphingobacterium spiritivorum]